MRCVYCQQAFAVNLTIREIFSLSKLLPKSLCQRCRQLFTLNNNVKKCPGCDKMFETGYCDDCRAWQRTIPGVVLNHKSLFCYDDALHDWFQQYKFKGDIGLASSFNRELSAYFRKKRHMLIVPIPVSDERLKSRGFNQVEELLKAAMISYVPLLKKKGEIESPQSNKTRRERLKAQQSFYLPEENLSLVKQQQVLIVDDVYTTGRTVLHAKACLAQGNPQSIQTFSLAR